MDEAKVDALGITPMQSRLDEIDALTDKASIADYCAHVGHAGEGYLFGFGPEAGLQGFVDEHRLRDPGRPRPAGSRLLLRQGQERQARRLPGARRQGAANCPACPADDAAKQAKAVVAFETRLAKASKSSEELSRDVSLYYNPVTPAEADKLTPNFPWTKFFQSQGLQAPEKFSLAMPAFHEEVSKMLGDVPVDTWKAYLRFHTVDGASPYLSEAVRRRELRFLRQDACAARRNRRRAGSACSARSKNEAGEAFGQMYVKVAFPAESKARMEALVQNLRDGAQGAHREARLDERRRPRPRRSRSGTASRPRSATRTSGATGRAWRPVARQLHRQRARRQRVQLQVETGQDRQAGGQDRMGHDPADGERLLQPAAERDRVPGRDPAAAVLRSEGRRRRSTTAASAR